MSCEKCSTFDKMKNANLCENKKLCSQCKINYTYNKEICRKCELNNNKRNCTNCNSEFGTLNDNKLCYPCKCEKEGKLCPQCKKLKLHFQKEICINCHLKNEFKNFKDE